MSAIHFQRCEDCSHPFYFPRAFCPACGGVRVPVRSASGAGTAVAVTMVMRAPTTAWKAHLPYLLCLVEMDEGFRMMGQAEKATAIGDRVEAGTIEIDCGSFPFFRVAADRGT